MPTLPQHAANLDARFAVASDIALPCRSEDTVGRCVPSASFLRAASDGCCHAQRDTRLTRALSLRVYILAFRPPLVGGHLDGRAAAVTLVGLWKARLSRVSLG